MKGELGELIIYEMATLGIKPQYFETFYEQLKKQQQLPPQDIVPTEQYKTIVDYLTQKEVLGADGAINEEILKVFDYSYLFYLF